MIKVKTPENPHIITRTDEEINSIKKELKEKLKEKLKECQDFLQKRALEKKNTTFFEFKNPFMDKNR